jgi:DNA repair photolyase
MNGGAPDDAGLVHFISEVGIWSVNPYRGCPFRCVYCTARGQGEAVPRLMPDEAAARLREALQDVPPDAELFVGAMADAYPPVEAELGLTREVLREVSRQGRAFCVNTKGTLVTRDTDVLKAHQGHCDVYVSLGMLDEAAVRALEPGAPPAAERLHVIGELHAAGIDVNVDASPWIPGVSCLEELLDRLPAGVGVQVTPLDLRHLGGRITLLGRALAQADVNASYAVERRRLGDRPGVLWKDAPAD